MDSFYNAPRQPPVRTAINTTGPAPVVPEVSVVENLLINHFEPGCNYTARPHHAPYKGNSYRDSLTYNPQFGPKKHVRFKSPNVFPVIHNKENIPESIKAAPNLNGETFKQIYLANVPDRHLDLSVYDPSPAHENKYLTCSSHHNISSSKDNLVKNIHVNVPKVGDGSICHSSFKPSSEIRTLKIRNRPTCNSPYKPSSEITALKVDKPPICNFPYKPLSEVATLKDIENLPKESEIATTTNEPTIKDLYRIIQQQNEQIMMLQRQVGNLKLSIRQPETEPVVSDNPHYSNSPTKKGLFSIDLKATSFEVSFRPQQKFRKQNDFLESKIQEIAELDNENTSLHLDESLSVKDSYMSAEPSIQINMDDYKSSDDDEASVNPGPTFYKNFMDQVNNILQNVSAQSESRQQQETGQVRKQVKQATLQHLRSIGVNLSPIQECAEMTGGSDMDNKLFDQSEISFAVKQLLMKYLPDEKLTQALNKQKQQPQRCIPKENKKISNPEFSFATVQYLKKYNIIDNCRQLPEIERRGVEDVPKILDVTALKQQPKLL